MKNLIITVFTLFSALCFAQAPDTLWTKTYGGESYDWGYSIQQTTDGGYIITGETWYNGYGQNDVILIKTDSLGNTLWTKIYGGISYERGEHVEQTSDGGYIITGIVLFQHMWDTLAEI